MVGILIALLALFLDQLTKSLAPMWQMPHERTLIPGFLHLAYTENRGAAWSFLAGQAWGIYLLSLLSLLAAIAFAVGFARSRDKQLRLIFSLLFAGAVGNLIDRIRLGYVVDFIDIQLGSYHWPTFNVADACLVVGVLLFLLWSWRRGQQDKPKLAEESDLSSLPSSEGEEADREA